MGDFLSSGSYVLLIILLAIVAYITYRIYLKSKKKKKSNKGENIDVINALVMDNGTGKFSKNVELSLEIASKIIEQCGSLGRLWDFDGKRTYALNMYSETVEGEKLYRPVVLSNRITNDPAALHYSLKQPAIELVITEALKDDDKSFMETWGVWIWWIAVMAFIGFMFTQS